MGDFNWTAVFKAAIEAPMEKFIIFFLIAMFVWQSRALLRLIRQEIGKLEKAVDQARSDSIIAQVNTKQNLDDHLKALMGFQKEMQSSYLVQTESFLKTKYELLQEVEVCKTKLAERDKAIAELGEGNAMVIKLMLEYKDRVDHLNKEMDRWHAVLLERKNKQ